MDEQQVRETLTRMMTDLDPEAEYEARHETDFVADMHQSRERVRGRDNMREFQRNYPPETMPEFTVERIVGHGDFWTVEATGDYAGERFCVVIVVQFRDGKIVHESRYYAQPFEAPEWRSQWVEPMD
jgi:ketosteroid isomerase-like protein